MFTEFIYPICLPLTCEILNEPLHNKFVIVAGWGLKQRGKFNITVEDFSELRPSVTISSGRFINVVSASV